MSRTGIWKRMLAIRDVIQPRDSIERRVADLPDRERRWYDAWRRECDTITQRLIAERGKGGAYEASLINGDQRWPEMPPAVEALLYPERAGHAQMDPKLAYEAMLKEEL